MLENKTCPKCGGEKLTLVEAVFYKNNVINFAALKENANEAKQGVVLYMLCSKCGANPALDIYERENHVFSTFKL